MIYSARADKSELVQSQIARRICASPARRYPSLSASQDLERAGQFLAVELHLALVGEHGVTADLASCPELDYIQIRRFAMRRHAAIKNGTAPPAARLDVSRFAPANRKRLSAPALRTFVAIADLWGLNEEQRRLILGYPSRSTYHGWAKQAREHGAFTLDVDVLTRISAVFGIHQALGVLFEDEREGVNWLRQPHGAPVFGDHPPLDLVINGTQDGLLTVRRFLDAARGGIYRPPIAADGD
jgi:hypothetical protein